MTAAYVIIRGPIVTAAPPLEQLLSRARRRFLVTRVVNDAPLAGSIILGSLLCAVLLGTDLLGPWILWPITMGSMGWLVWRVLRSSPTSYSLAQQLDHRLGLSDLISSAWHFWSSPVAMAQALRHRAEASVSQVSVEAAYPIQWPRSVWVATALAVSVLGLGAYRYAKLDRLDLAAPILALDAENAQTQAMKNEPPKSPLRRFAERMKQAGMSLDTLEEAMGWNTSGQDKAGQNSADKQGRPGENGAKTPSPNQGAKSEEQAQSGESPESQGQQQEQGEGDPNRKDQQANASNQQGGQPQQRDSLIDKMRDAIANMKDKLQNGQQQQQAQAGQPKQGQQQGQNQSPQSPQAGQQNKPQDQNQAEQQGQNQQGGPPDQRVGEQAAAQTSQQSKSGMGATDGDKTLQEQRMQEAAGKISEILGRRAENMTGDIQVKVTSKTNQLTTRYSDQGNKTYDAGAGDQPREEIPAEHQAYIKRYFVEIHKGDKTIPSSK